MAAPVEIINYETHGRSWPPLRATMRLFLSSLIMFRFACRLLGWLWSVF